MANRSWTVTYRDEQTNEKVVAAVFAETLEQATELARADAKVDGNRRWCIESIEPHEETLARILISEFAEKQQGGHFACPRCGKMTMEAESVTRNALSRRASVYVCDICGTEEAIEDMGAMSRLQLMEWAIARAPELWRVKE